MFSNLKISMRIVLGFAALVALIALLAGLAVLSGTNTKSSVAELERTSTVVSALKDALLSVRQGRVQAWTYMATGDNSYLKERDAAFDLFRKQYAEVDARLKSPIGRQLIKDFDDSVTTFEAKARVMNELKAKGVAADAPEMKTAVADVNDAAKHYAETNAKAADFEADLSRKAAVTADSQVGGAIDQALGGGIIGVVLGGAFAWFIGRGITRPINAMTGAMGRLADGDLAIDVTGTDRRDEIGSLARSLEVFKRNAVEAKRLAARDAEETAAKAQRSIRIDHDIAGFDNSVRGALDLLAAAATQLRATAQSLAGGAGEASRQSTAVAAAAEQASANVQTVAAASEELSSSISEITRQVTQSSEIAGQAVEEASETQATIGGLSEAAQRIGAVVRLINDIASQTNLLALNATIEAARAGEAGKGFAVVASEVKALANQTAKATEEIAIQVNAMQSATEEAVGAIERINGTIRRMNEISTGIAAAMEQQGAATKEISRNVQQAAHGTHEVTQNIVGVNRAIGETGAASGQVLTASDELGRQAEILRGDVGSFLVKIRAA
jgi:methyl-accepting chemotaxis protein